MLRAQWTVLAEQIIGQAIVAHRPAADKGDGDLCRFQFRVDEVAPSILSQFLRAGLKDKLPDERFALTVILAGARATPLVDGERLFKQPSPLSQRAIDDRGIHVAAYLTDTFVNTPFATLIVDQIFHAIVPEVQQEDQDARLAIIITLFPAKQQLDFALFACLNYRPLPEARRIGNGELNDGGTLNWRCPLRINFAALQAQEGATGLFAHLFLLAHRVDGGQDIGGIGVLLFTQCLQDGDLYGFCLLSKIGKCRFYLCLVGTCM